MQLRIEFPQKNSFYNDDQFIIKDYLFTWKNTFRKFSLKRLRQYPICRGFLWRTAPQREYRCEPLMRTGDYSYNEKN